MALFSSGRPASHPPADRITLKSWDKEGKEKKRRGEEEERRKDIKRTGGKKDRPRVDLEGGPAQPGFFHSFLYVVVARHDDDDEKDVKQIERLLEQMKRMRMVLHQLKKLIHL